MENAAKALGIAGGILLSIIIIAMIVYVFTSASSVQSELDASTLTEQIRQYNAQYEAYDKKVMRGIDIITITNKAINNNKLNSGYPIEIIVKINSDSTWNEGVTVFDNVPKGEYNFTKTHNSLYNNLIKSNGYDVSVFKEYRFFECTKVYYNNLDGRVSKMTFNEITETVLKDKIDYSRY